MQDGAELGQAIVAHSGDVEAALAEDEQLGFTRRAAGGGDDDIYGVMFGDDAPHSLITLFAGAQ